MVTVAQVWVRLLLSDSDIRNYYDVQRNKLESRRLNCNVAHAKLENLNASKKEKEFLSKARDMMSVHTPISSRSPRPRSCAKLSRSLSRRAARRTKTRRNPAR